MLTTSQCIGRLERTSAAQRNQLATLANPLGMDWGEWTGGDERIPALVRPSGRCFAGRGELAGASLSRRWRYAAFHRERRRAVADGRRRKPTVGLRRVVGSDVAGARPSGRE